MAQALEKNKKTILFIFKCFKKHFIYVNVIAFHIAIIGIKFWLDSLNNVLAKSCLDCLSPEDRKDRKNF